MSWYAIAVVLHVVVAVLGVGPVGALAIVASCARRAGTALPQAAIWITPLLRYTRFSLAAVLGTGIWIDVAAAGVYHHAWWVRLSAILVVVTFLFHRRATAAISRAVRGEGDSAAAFWRVERAAWAMCGTVALVTILMEAKPF
jgi:uncharacterized membrane protein